MEAQPIVNRLQEQYGALIEFESLNAVDDADGQRAFEKLVLPGHPAIVIFDPEEEEVYRAFGFFEDGTLESELIAMIE